MSVEELRHLAVVCDYIGLIGAIRARIAKLGISYETVDELAGFTTRYSSKLLIEEPRLRGGTKQTHAARMMGIMAFDAILGAVGVKLALIEDADGLARLKRMSAWRPRRYRVMHTGAVHDYVVRRDTREFMRKIGSKGGTNSRAGLSSKRRKQIARKAAKARWDP